MNKTEDLIKDHIIKNYNPVAIILHGSRANGMARQNSDWDILLLSSGGKRPHREILITPDGEANIDYHQITLPIPEDKSIGFEFRSKNTKILLDHKGIAENLITKANSVVAKGNQFDEVDQRARKAFLLSSLNGISDYADNPLILFDKKIDFYTRITMSWFQFLRNEFEPSHYLAFPKIKTEDPEFFELIERFIASNLAEELIVIGKEIIARLFPGLNNK